jgi:hypothetical protein
VLKKVCLRAAVGREYAARELVARSGTKLLPGPVVGIFG